MRLLSFLVIALFSCPQTKSISGIEKRSSIEVEGKFEEDRVV
jgi:hypothetical protein